MQNGLETVDTTPLSPSIRVEELVSNCNDLLSELDQFAAFLVEQGKEDAIELRPFRNSVASELKSLAKLSTADPHSERTIHTLRSSNLPFLAAVWTAAKASRGLVTFSKRFYWEKPPPRARAASKPKKQSALVDIVAEDGLEWVKVSTVSESRLLFEKAKAGWEDDSSSDDGEDGGKVLAAGAEAGPYGCAVRSEGEDEDDRIELLKVAGDLQKASKAVKVRYKHPRVRFVLPKITEETPTIKAILADVRATGAIVDCGSSTNISGTAYAQSTSLRATASLTTAPTLSTVFSHLIPSPISYLTSTLNIDCTILLALVSDLSHATISPLPTHHRAIRRQIDLESKERLLPSSLYPGMTGRALVCTAAAATRMREIVNLIGTPSERVRTALLLGDLESGLESTPTSTADVLRARFAATSVYAVPQDWMLPVRVLDETPSLANLPKVAEAIKKQLTPINQSVFLLGWAKGWTTVSSNRMAARCIEEMVDREGDEDDEGPSVWLCGTARSLVGKEKGR